MNTIDACGWYAHRPTQKIPAAVRSEPVNLRQSFRRARTVPLPWYDDSSRLWHYHVVCKHCLPDWLNTPLPSTSAVPTRAEALRLQQEYNADIPDHLFVGHRHVIMGCAGTRCTVQSLAPD